MLADLLSLYSNLQVGIKASIITIHNLQFGEKAEDVIFLILIFAKAMSFAKAATLVAIGSQQELEFAAQIHTLVHAKFLNITQTQFVLIKILR